MLALKQMRPSLVELMHTCPALCTRLGLQGLACLATCSSNLKNACSATTCRDALELLDPTVKVARQGQLLEHHQQAALWLAALLQNAGAATTAAAVTQQLMSLPSVALPWAVQLVAAGVHIAYAQLLAAANSMLAGVEVWVQAQQQLGVQTDIPEAAVAICCGDEWNLTATPDGDAAALLQLAMNCSNPATAAAAASHLPEELEAGAARRLLLTAAARQHTEAVQQMTDLPFMQQHIDADTLEAVLRQLLAQGDCVQQLCRLPAAVQLSSEAVVCLLLDAVERHEAHNVRMLCGLAGAQQMSSEQMIDLLLGACTRIRTDFDDCSIDCVVDIGKLPAATALGIDDVMQLLAAVFQQCNCPDDASIHESDTSCTFLITRQLLSAAAAAELTDSQVVQLFSAAVMCNCVAGVMAMRASDIAGRLSSEMLLQLLQQAVEHGACACTASLCGLQAAQQLSCGDMERLFTAAVEHASAVSLLSLSRLPAAQQLSCEAMVRLLQASVDAKSVFVLSKLPAAGRLSSEAAAGLLLEAAMQRKHEAVKGLCLLAGSQQMSSKQALGLLEACACACADMGGVCVVGICALPAAQALSITDVVQLLGAAFQQGCCLSDLPGDDPRVVGTTTMVVALLNLPAAAGLSSTQVVQLVTKAAVCNNVVGFRVLVGLGFAERLSSETLLQSLQQAVEQGRGVSTVAVMLCKLPQAQQFSCGAVEGLLAAAIQRSSATAAQLWGSRGAAGGSHTAKQCNIHCRIVSAAGSTAAQLWGSRGAAGGSHTAKQCNIHCRIVSAAGSTAAQLCGSRGAGHCRSPARQRKVCRSLMQAAGRAALRQRRSCGRGLRSSCASRAGVGSLPAAGQLSCQTLA
ncbi:hypothetical protein COO60DRAFT_1075045 [Scenedesmus sp. NREL 46B-D3]|nr:hypothetical protein COO60DRAFT_1075045 [Scenedesmus sp. NREL 46B-D3]